MRRTGPLAALLVLSACGSNGPGPVPTPSPTPVNTCTGNPAAHAVGVVDWWLPNCSIAQNAWADPLAALGAPDAEEPAPGVYRGFVSLGFGGFVSVDMGGCIVDQPGNDLRVYQAVSSEPLSVYVSESAEGPYTLLRPRYPCGERISRVVKFCDFDLAEGGVTKARYVKVQDGELYPCPGDTNTEGADFDAVRALAVAVP